jgi:hypothetical protein
MYLLVTVVALWLTAVNTSIIEITFFACLYTILLDLKEFMELYGLINYKWKLLNIFFLYSSVQHNLICLIFMRS